MKFGHINAGEKIWRWFKVPDTKAEIELKLITRSELQAMSSAGDIAAESSYAAQHFFRDFKGCVDANGVEIPNTVENRTLMLQDLDFGAWVNRRLLDVTKWRDEGKDESGSAS